MYNEIFKDRVDAGLQLSDKLKKYQNSDAIILAVPRGGVPVGYVIAKKLNLPLDIILSKKIPHPLNKEYAIGAVSMNSLIVDEHSGISNDYIEKQIVRLRELLQKKYELYMGDRKPLDVKGKNVILVDDGIATGNTLLVSIEMLRKRKPAKIIVAAPVVPVDRVDIFEEKADEFIHLMAPEYFRGVGAFYERFGQVQDAEVIRILKDLHPVT